MTIIVTRENASGVLPRVGGTDIILFNHYKTYKNALKYGAKPYARGKRFKVEYWSDSDRIFYDPEKILYYNEQAILRKEIFISRDRYDKDTIKHYDERGILESIEHRKYQKYENE